MRRRPMRPTSPMPPTPPRPFANLCEILAQPPDAVADVRGGGVYPRLGGTVRFYQTRYGVLVSAEVVGLPTQNGPCTGRVFGFHIHEGDACRGTQQDPFASVGGHYNPAGCEHPHHAGDLPPLFGNHGYALSVFLTDRFTVDEVVGRTLIIHGGVDDFTSQPAGNAGQKIACGRIMRRN